MSTIASIEALIVPAARKRLAKLVHPQPKRCHHGHLARSCEICERDLMIASLRRLLEEAANLLTYQRLWADWVRRAREALKP